MQVKRAPPNHSTALPNAISRKDLPAPGFRFNEYGIADELDT